MKTRVGHHLGAFTLLEIMVAMFLFAIVVAAVYSSWTAVVRGSRIGLNAAAEVQRSRVAIRTLEEALTTVRLFTADAEYYSFEAENGNKAYLSFVSYLPQSFPRSGKFGDFNVRRVTFSIEPAPDWGSQLVLRQNPMLMEMDKDEKEHPIVLAKNVKGLEMEFWDLRAGEWVDEWTQTNQLPSMVKITLQFGDRARAGIREQVTRIIGVPSVAVPSNWQVPGGRPGVPGAAGGGPNVLRPGMPVNQNQGGGQP
jgi:type II secretion system protein J